jgi:hypothetical protein
VQTVGAGVQEFELRHFESLTQLFNEKVFEEAEAMIGGLGRIA